MPHITCVLHAAARAVYVVVATSGADSGVAAVSVHGRQLYEQNVTEWQKEHMMHMMQ